VVGIDQSPEMLAAGRDRVAHAGLNERIELREGRAEDLPFADGEFDAATFTYLLRYVDDVPATLSELARVVRPGGFVVAEITNRHSLAAFGYGGAPVTKLARAEVEDAFCDNGLDVLEWWAGTRLPHGVWARASTTRRALPVIWVERALDPVLGTIGARSLICAARKSSGSEVS